MNFKFKTKRGSLLKRKRKLFGTYIDTVPFKEPIAYMKRRNGNVEFLEDITKSQYEFKHSSGEKRKIYIDPVKDMLHFKAGKKAFRGYWLDEDKPTPITTNPVLEVEQVGVAMDKTLNDIKTWKAKELAAQTEMIKTVGYVIVGGIFVYGVYLLMTGQVGNSAPAVAKVVETVAKNISNATSVIKPVVFK